MNSDQTEDAESVAVEQLERFGLSSYAARTFVALASLGAGTAREVSQVSDVPRTRVYGAVEELQEQGLVDVQDSSPKRFWATSPETASRSFEHDFERRVDLLRSALDEIEPEERGSTEQNVWTVDGGEAVGKHVHEFVDDAEEEIVYTAVEELFSEDLLDALADAADRGVSVTVSGPSAIEEQVHNVIPSVTTFDPPWDWSQSTPGRLVVVDGQRTLVSSFSDNPGTISESAILGEGDGNSLVTVLKAITTWRREE